MLSYDGNTADVGQRVRECIVRSLELEVNPDEISGTMFLFVDQASGGLGLDSLAALEIFVALSEEFGLTAEDVDEKAFSDVDSITAWITSQRVS